MSGYNCENNSNEMIVYDMKLIELRNRPTNLFSVVVLCMPTAAHRKWLPTTEANKFSGLKRRHLKTPV